MAPIHEAAKAGDVAALRRELEAGVAPDLGDVYNSTPLCLAMTYIGPLNKEAATACCAMHRARSLGTTLSLSCLWPANALRH